MKNKQGLLFLSLVPLFTVLYSCALTSGGEHEAMAEISVKEEIHEATASQGVNGFIPAGDFTELTGRIRYNQVLSGIFREFGVVDPVIDSLNRACKGVFDPRNLRTGNRYTAFLMGDSLSRLHYLVYEHSPVEQVVFDLVPPVSVYITHKEIRREKKITEAEIETSLWDAMTKNNINPALAIELSEIFAWTIDFFGLQKGDHFRVIYEESFVDSLSLGIGQVFGAVFHHMGQPFYAIPLVQDSLAGYYDQYGNSLRKAFLKAPLRFSRISSRFSYSRMHPILKYRRPHFGVDYAAPVGTPVVAIGDGRVLEASYKGEAGRMVRIRHNSVYTTAYLHLRNFAPGIYPGAWVRQGQVIGYVGSSGLSTGPHLDFRFYKNGSPVDPLKVEAPPVEPVKEDNMEHFVHKRRIMIDLLDGDLISP